MTTTGDSTGGLAGDTLAIETTATEGGCGLQTLVHRPSGAAFALGEEGTPFWELEFRNGAGYRLVLDSLTAGEFTVEAGDDVWTLRWEEVPLRFRDQGRQGEVTVTVDVRLPGDGLSRWRLSVDMSAEAVTLWGVTFPRLEAVDRIDTDSFDGRLLVPDGWGASVDPGGSERFMTWDDQLYPSGSLSMGVLALEAGDTSLYLGLHDPDGEPKDVGVVADGDGLSLGVEQFPEEMGRCQSGFELGYDIVLGAVEGDWYDAAQVYREWATTDPPWTARGPIADRADVPEWFKRTAIWWTPGWAEIEPSMETDHETVEELTETLLALRERFDVPMGAHWYRWHQIPFDTDHPDYFPPREGFVEAVADLQSAGIHVMPYVNARVADPNSDAWTEQGLHRGVVERASARHDPSTRERLRDIRGANKQWRSPMCGATQVWRDSVETVVDRLVESFGVDAVYLDVLGARAPRRCFAPDHDHPLGGGSYGVAGYRELVDSLSGGGADDAPVAVTTECSAEPYMDGLAGHLLWQSARPDQVPLLPTVYGDYTVGFGREFFPEDLEDPAVFRSKLGHLFWLGGQLGWLSMPVARRLLDADHEDTADYLAETAGALTDAWEYVTAGRRLRDPTPRSSLPEHDITWDTDKHGSWTGSLPPVLAATWEPADGDAPAVAVTNWSTDHHAPTWTVDGAFPATTRVRELTTGAVRDCTVEGSKTVLETPLSPGSTKVFVFASE